MKYQPAVLEQDLVELAHELRPRPGAAVRAPGEEVRAHEGRLVADLPTWVENKESSPKTSTG